jgi:hypothetical protein
MIRNVVLLTVYAMLLGGCLHTDEVVLGDDVPADLLIVLRGDVTDEEREQVHRDVLDGAPIDGRPGTPLADGVRLVMASQVEDRDAIVVGFHPDATPEQRATVRRAAEAHPAVDRVLVGVAPAEVQLD